MEWVFIVLVAVAWYYLSNNKAANQESIEEERYQRIETKDGHIIRKTKSTRTRNTVNHTDRHESIMTNNERNYTPAANNFSQPKERVINEVGNYQAKPVSARLLQSVKRCTKCSQEKNTTEFFATNKYKDGLSKWCSNCINNNKSKPNSKYKFCPNCNNNRLKSNFFKSKKQPDGLTKWCKPCHK